VAGGLLVLGLAAHASRDRLERSIARWLSGETWFDPAPGLAGRTVGVEPGDIAVREFLRFLADFTGRPVVLDAGLAHALDNTILIVQAMDQVDGDMTLRILEASGFTVRSTTPGEGGLRVEAGSWAPCSTP
jgi:hypothetical protein